MAKHKFYKGPRPTISLGFGLPEGELLKADSITGADEEMESECACIGRSCCPYPHFYMRTDGETKWNWWPDRATGALIAGDDAALQAYVDGLV